MGTGSRPGPLGAWALRALVMLALLTAGGVARSSGSAGAAGALGSIERWVQTDWSGGPGQIDWRDGDVAAYAAGDGVDTLAAGQVGLGYTLPYTTTGDLDQDGYPDIVFTNWLDQYPPQHHGVPSSVYWGGADGFSLERRLDLPTRGAVGVSVADLDQDGTLDLVFSNQRGGLYESPRYRIDSYIYWGGPGGYSVQRRTELPTLGAMSSAIADLNADGQLDIVFANSTDGTTAEVDSYIYWGGPDGYDPDNRSGLPVRRAVGVSAVDLDQDGYLDIIFSNTTDGAFSEIDSYIYWGSEEGYSPDRRIGLPTIGAYDNAAGDLNGDGYLDLVFSNRYRQSYGGPYDFDVPSYIYWGSAAGYGVDARSELPTVGAVAVSVIDLDGDGYLDIIFSNGSDRYGYIYWGDPAASYGVEQRTEFRAHQSLAHAVADVDGDGHLDLIIAGDWNGLVYYGDGSRDYSGRRRAVLTTMTSLGVAVAGARSTTAGSSMGSVYTRPISGNVSMDEAFLAPRIHGDAGYLQSSAFDARGGSRWLALEWQALLPPGTALSIALATSEEGAAWTDWRPVAEATSDEPGSVDLTGLVAPSRYVRYLVVLTASSDHRQTPWLQEIALAYEHLEPTVTPTLTATATAAPTPTSTVGPSPTCSATPSHTPSPSPSATATPSPSATATVAHDRYLPLVCKSN